MNIEATLEDFVPLNQQQRKAKQELIIAIRQRDAEIERLKAYADHTYFCGTRAGDVCDCGFEHKGCQR